MKNHSEKFKDPSFFDGWDEEDLEDAISSFESQIKEHSKKGGEMPKQLKLRVPELESMKKNLASRKSKSK